MTKYCIIYNPMAGTAIPLQQIEAAFAAHRINPKIFTLNSDLKATIRKMVRSGHNVFIAAGGDGTVNSLVNCLTGGRFKIGLIPMGTSNHLAQDLNIPQNIDEAIKIILRGKVKRLDVASINNKLFLNNSSIGLYPHLISRRQKNLGRLVRRLSDLINVVAVLIRPPKYKVEVRIDGNKIRRRASLIFVGNNYYDVKGLGLANRQSLSGGQLCLYLIKSDSSLQLIWLFIKVVLGKAHTETVFEEYQLRRVVISTKSQRLKVATDGEVGHLKPPLIYQLLPKHLAVIIP